MDKNKCLKTAKLFLKSAECDFALIKIIKIVKIILTTMLLIKSTVFIAMIICGMRKKA